MHLSAIDLPPGLIRVLARKGPKAARVPMTRAEIAARAGTSLRTIDRISKLQTFDSVQVGMARRFCVACGVTQGALRRQIAFLRRKPAMLKKHDALFRRILQGTTG